MIHLTDLCENIQDYRIAHLFVFLHFFWKHLREIFALNLTVEQQTALKTVTKLLKHNF